MEKIRILFASESPCSVRGQNWRIGLYASEFLLRRRPSLCICLPYLVEFGFCRKWLQKKIHAMSNFNAFASESIQCKVTHTLSCNLCQENKKYRILFVNVYKYLIAVCEFFTCLL